MPTENKISHPYQMSESQVALLRAVNDAYLLELQSYLPALDLHEADPVVNCAIPPAKVPYAVRLIEIRRIMYDKRENALDSLSNILSSLGENYGVGLIIQGKGAGCSLYLATRIYDVHHTASTGQELLMNGMGGHFSGSQSRVLDNEEAQKLLKDCFPENTYNWGVCASSIVPSLKHDGTMTTFTQSLDRFIDAMAGREYTALILAEPIGSRQLDMMKSSTEDIGTCLSPMQKYSLTLSQSESSSQMETLSQTLTRGINQSVTQSQSYASTESFSSSHATSVAEGTSKSLTNSANYSLSNAFTQTVSLGLCAFWGPVGGMISGSLSSTEGVTKGVGTAVTTGTTRTDTKTETETTSNSDTETRGSAVQEGSHADSSQGVSQAAGTSRETGSSHLMEFIDMGVTRFYSRLEEKLDRLEGVRACGAWAAAAFFVAPSHHDATVAASLYQGMLRGQESMKNHSALLHWREEGAKSVLPWLRELLLPRFRFEGITVTPGVPVSSQELALMMCLPRRSVGGITVLDAVGFGREVRPLREGGVDAKNCLSMYGLRLGNVYHKYRQENRPVNLDVDTLCRHVLVSGTTGTGKSRTMQHILQQMYDRGVPFLVIEPAKSEYRCLGALPGVCILQAGSIGADGLHLNPFSFPVGSRVTLSSHIDRVCAVFNAAFPMYAAMPQILEKAIYLAYEAKGWDVASSRCIEVPMRFPTIADVGEKIREVIRDAGYTGESYDTYIGALKARLDSFTYGSLGFILSAASSEEETPATVLFNSPCVVNIAALGSVEKKSVLMGLLLIRLLEHRMASQFDAEEDVRLRHVTVIEEAHNLLKASNREITVDSSNPRGQAVEFFANAISEMRAYGESFFVVDQSASALDMSVLRNTNTKVAFNAPLEEDRRILAGALALDDLQEEALARLPAQVAVVKQNNWTEAVLCHIADWRPPTIRQEDVCRPAVEDDADRQSRARLLRLLRCAVEGKSPILKKEEKTFLHKWTQKHGFGFDLIHMRNVIEGKSLEAAASGRLVRKILQIDHRFFSSAISPEGRKNCLKAHLTDILKSREEAEQFMDFLFENGRRG